MNGSPEPDPRYRALEAALDAVDRIAVDVPSGLVPTTSVQWRRSLSDAQLDQRVEEFEACRAQVSSASQDDNGALGRRLRPAAIRLASAAANLCRVLEILSAFDTAGEGSPPIGTWRRPILDDARSVLRAAVDGQMPIPPPAWIVDRKVDDRQADRDVLLEIFGVSDGELRDRDGSFCDSRLIAFYRLKLVELQEVCDPIMGLVAEHPPSVFTAASAVRDLATSVSPFVTLWSAREVRSMILAAHETDPVRTRAVLPRSERDGDKEGESFRRLQQSMRRAEAAHTSATGTESDYALSILEAYRHMAEGITRRSVGTLLRLSGLEGPTPTLGRIGEPALARLGEFGTRVESALVPAMRNAEAHDDVVFDEDRGLLVGDSFAFHPDEIVARLTDLDILQRGFVIGRLAAFADEPKLGDWSSASPDGRSQGTALAFARGRFGHAGQRVRSFVRNRDRIDVVLDDLDAETCNPCFVALTQSAQVLPTVSRFTVSISSREEPVIDLPADVLHRNWTVFGLAAALFPHALPQSTFLPCLTWCRLACESTETAARTAAWIALNDAAHAILDANAASSEYRRLPARLNVVAAASAAASRVLPEGPHLDQLLRAQRIARAASNVLTASPGTAAARVLTDRIFGLHASLGGPFPVLPTLNPSPSPESSYPHKVS